MTNRFYSARKFAENLIKKNSLSPPVNPTELITSLGIEIIEKENQLGIEAFSKLDEHPTITINPAFDFPARKRFTLAHELGHIIIPWHNGDTKCFSDNPYSLISLNAVLDTQELEANVFASELLMPHEWLKTEVTKILSETPLDLENIIKKVSTKSKTSIMATMYALENALPQGHLYYVKPDLIDYWKKFSSSKINLNPFYDEYNLSDFVCEYKKEFHISQYQVLHYYFRPCPDQETIGNVFSSVNNNIKQLVDIITDYEPLKILPNISIVIDSLPDKYLFCLYKDNNRIFTYKSSDCKLNCYTDVFSTFIDILVSNDINYDLIKYKNFKLLFIKENFSFVPTVYSCDANQLLKDITAELYPEGSRRELMSINGIISSINSTNKNASSEELYNLIKSRFSTDVNYFDFYNHECFDMYVVNKIESMIKKRKN